MRGRPWVPDHPRGRRRAYEDSLHRTSRSAVHPRRESMVRSIGCVAALSLTLVAGCPKAGKVPPSGGVLASEPPDSGAVSPAAELARQADAVAASYGFGARHRRDPSDLCEPVRENLDRAARAIVAQPTTGAPWT